jgi:hypothetical protein
MPEARLTADERREWSRRIRARLIAGYYWRRMRNCFADDDDPEFQMARRLALADQALGWIDRFVVAVEDVNIAEKYERYPGAATDWSDLLTWLRVNAALTDASVTDVTFGSPARRRQFNRRVAHAIRKIKCGILDAGEPRPDWPPPPPHNRRFSYPAYLRHMARHTGWRREAALPQR